MIVSKTVMTVWVCGLITAAALFLASPAMADIVTPGTTGSPSFLIPTGALLADTGILAWNSATMSGLGEAQVLSDPTNTFCNGCLDFVFTISIDTTSTDAMERVTDRLFTGFQTDVGFNPTQTCTGGSVSVAPFSVDRSLNGSVVGFNFAAGNPVGQGECAALVVETDAMSFAPGTLNMIDGSVGSIASFEPTTTPTPTPEPASLALLGTGLCALAGIRRRKVSV